ncbi:hypothetical protein H310_13552 [Aphanomyces invadans]|uniref:Uncharacterized protein n=1 Tax=Aphanomyces invadans TaxID=157072 RepID=A0A024TFB6_9STRA|nr:hypothetical protein H310_13552 [Aphanomyces invadans]ETV92027.1 hypothetical protein H310_13552 [Aphanomyces invadans]|eukprot:XP_008879324.1 hypothetical protein H310_13552 [Aphanomyces invadans]
MKGLGHLLGLPAVIITKNNTHISTALPRHVADVWAFPGTFV